MLASSAWVSGAFSQSSSSISTSSSSEVIDDLFFFVIVVEAMAEIIVIVITEVVIVICGSCVELDRVIQRHLHFPLAAFELLVSALDLVRLQT